MHTPSIPYHPKGNGRTEAAVKVAQLIHVKESELLLYRDKGTPSAPSVAKLLFDTLRHITTHHMSK